MHMKTPKLILIDLDGTLVDSVPDLAYCVDTMMEKIGRPAYGEDRVRDWVGNGVERLTRRALIGQLEGEPTDEDFEKAYPIFLDLYDKHNGEKSGLYPGVREGLNYLKTTGIRMGCVTNKAAQFTVPLLKALGVYDDFEIVISGDTLPKKKPDPMPLLHGAKHFGVDPSECMMLGDSVSDVKAARAAGFGIICMSYGYNHGNDIRDANPDHVIDSFVELKGLLTEAA
ncbi:MAG: phosphoglycolate phosphatase [Candidatus Sedimenticola sp. 6PFRAG7]